MKLKFYKVLKESLFQMFIDISTTVPFTMLVADGYRKLEGTILSSKHQLEKYTAFSVLDPQFSNYL